MFYTLSFDEKVNGWTSFFSYDPEMMTNLNNDFFTFKNGQLYVHNQDIVVRNVFYDNPPAPTYVEVLMNTSPSEVKIFKTIELEGSSCEWDVIIDTNIDSGHINKESFKDKEGICYDYIKRNEEDRVNTKLLSVQGIGTLLSYGSTPSCPDILPPNIPQVVEPSDPYDTTPTISGTAEPSSTITFVIGGSQYTTTSDSNGDWQITTSELAYGTYTYTATSTDSSGNVSDPATGSITILAPTTTTTTTTTAAPTTTTTTTAAPTTTTTTTAAPTTTTTTTAAPTTTTTTADPGTTTTTTTSAPSSGMFKATFDTTITSAGSSASDQIKLPLDTSYSSYNATIYWGDGTNTLVTGIGTYITHTYPSPGIYQISVDGTFAAMLFNLLPAEAPKLLSVDDWGSNYIFRNNTARVFQGCINLDLSSVLGVPTLGNTMENMFFGCSSLTTINNVSLWNTSGVISFKWTFWGCSNFNDDLSAWDVSNADTLQYMFNLCTSFNGDINGWTFKTGADILRILSETTLFNRPLNNWNISGINNLSSVFYNASSFNQDISSWDTSNVTNMTALFSGASSFNQDISIWNTSSVTLMTSMFNNASSFNQDLSSWCVTNITSQPSGFDTGATAWTLPRPIWGTCPTP